MLFKNDQIRAEQIDLVDNRYRISTDSDSEDLLGSVRRTGLLNPPFVESKGSGVAVISGFRRIDACLRLRLERIPVRIIDEKTPLKDRILLAVAENSLQRPLNLIETSRALNLIAAHFPEIADLCSVCRDLGLPVNPEQIRKISKLSLLPLQIQTAVIEEVVALSIALALEDLEPEAGVMLCELFRKLKAGFNIQQELISWVKEIAVRDRISESRILEDPAFLAITADHDLDRTLKRQAVRKYFKRLRYPTLSRYEETFEKNRARLKIGSSIKLDPPPFFEGRSYTVTIRFSSLSSLEDRVLELSKLVTDPAMKEILAGKD